MVLIDADVPIDIFTDDTTWADWSEQTLETVAIHKKILINPIIYAKISFAFKDPAPLDKVLQLLNIKLEELPIPAAFLAGKVFIKYRKLGGLKRSPLPGFYIGAHALHSGLTLLTHDPKRYKTYFPQVELISP